MLRDPTILPTNLMQFDVVIVSYNFVMHQWKRKMKYLHDVAYANENGGATLPERPILSLFSGIFDSTNGIKSPYLVLDEVNAVKNERSITFEAVSELRTRCDTCIMLSSSPIDNSWPDVFARLTMSQQTEEGKSIDSVQEGLSSNQPQST